MELASVPWIENLVFISSLIEVVWEEILSEFSLMRYVLLSDEMSYPLAEKSWLWILAFKNYFEYASFYKSDSIKENFFLPKGPKV